jgi:hypothetical protein
VIIKQRLKNNALVLGALLVDILTTVITVLFFGLEQVIPTCVVIFMVVLLLKNYIILFINTVFKRKAGKKDLEIALLKQENEHLEEIAEMKKNFEVKYKMINEDGDLLTEDMKKVEEFNGKK